MKKMVQLLNAIFNLGRSKKLLRDNPAEFIDYHDYANLCDTSIRTNEERSFSEEDLSSLKAYAMKHKTNPHAVRYGIACSLNDDLSLINKEGLMNVKAKDISLLGKDSRFSNPLTSREFYRITGIEEVRIVDIPENVPTKKSFEEISLEGLEYEE